MPYASLAVSWGERDPAGGSAGGGVVLVSVRGTFVGVVSGRGDFSLPFLVGVGFGVGSGVEREEAGVGEGEESAFSQPVSEGSGVGFAARGEPEVDLVTSQITAKAMIANTAVNRITFRQSNDRRRSGCQSDECSESCLEEPLPRREDPACPSGKSEARHDIGPNIRLTVIYLEGKGLGN